MCLYSSATGFKAGIEDTGDHFATRFVYSIVFRPLLNNSGNSIAGWMSLSFTYAVPADECPICPVPLEIITTNSDKGEYLSRPDHESRVYSY